MSSAPGGRSPVTLLYSDTILSILPFLSWRDMVSAHASCRLWRDAAHREPCRRIRLPHVPGRFELASPLRHHVSEYKSAPGTSFLTLTISACWQSSLRCSTSRGE